MELTILILLLPFFSFLILGIGGKWMSHRTAGTIGTLILGAVAAVSYTHLDVYKRQFLTVSMQICVILYSVGLFHRKIYM